MGVISMQAVEIKKGIYWVGVKDWNLREFHGYTTSRGSTYNAYLIIDDKITLIDGVKAPFTDLFMQRVASVIDPQKIDVVVCNHVEMDHSGALPAIMEKAKNATLYCPAAGERGLSMHYDTKNWKIRTVKTGDTLNTGLYPVLRGFSSVRSEGEGFHDTGIDTAGEPSGNISFHAAGRDRACFRADIRHRQHCAEAEPRLRPRPGVSSEEKRQIRQDFPVNQERSGFHGRFVEAFMFILLQRYMPTGKKQAMLDCFPEKFSVCSFFRKTFIPQKFRCALSITAVLSLRQTGDPERGCSPPERDRASPPVRRQRNAGNDSLSQPRAEVGSGFHFEIFP